jgi:hypothetical protein
MAMKIARRRISIIAHFLVPNNYINGRMPTKKTEQQEHRWRIVRITDTPAKLVGHVYAPDEETAVKLAIAQFDIEKSWRNRLMAIRET